MKGIKIAVELGTRLQIIIRRQYKWEIWTACNTRTGDSYSWLGTYFELHDNGAIYQMTRTPDGVETELKIKDADND